MNMYFIALVLPNELDKLVLKWKRYMQDNYNCKVSLKSPAHITIIPPFWLEPAKENQLLTDANLVASQTAAFTIRTNHFSAFKPRTIFIAVQPNQQLEHLKARANAVFCATNFYKLKPENRPFHPHITIATRDLFKKDFYEAWRFFEKEVFAEEWQAVDLSVLRHNQKTWEVIYTADFNKKIF